MKEVIQQALREFIKTFSRDLVPIRLCMWKDDKTAARKAVNSEVVGARPSRKTGSQSMGGPKEFVCVSYSLLTKTQTQDLEN